MKLRDAFSVILFGFFVRMIRIVLKFILSFLFCFETQLKGNLTFFNKFVEWLQVLRRSFSPKVKCVFHFPQTCSTMHVRCSLNVCMINAIAIAFQSCYVERSLFRFVTIFSSALLAPLILIQPCYSYYIQFRRIIIR